jgi:hypothetical protein
LTEGSMRRKVGGESRIVKQFLSLNNGVNAYRAGIRTRKNSPLFVCFMTLFTSQLFCVIVVRCHTLLRRLSFNKCNGSIVLLLTL